MLHKYSDASVDVHIDLAGPERMRSQLDEPTYLVKSRIVNSNIYRYANITI